MEAQTSHIKAPSKKLLKFFMKLRAAKEENKAKLIAEKDKFFPQTK